MDSINSYSCFSRLCLYGEILAWNFLSKLFAEDGCSEVKVRNSFWMGPDEKMINSSWSSSLNSINSPSCFLNFDQMETFYPGIFYQSDLQNIDVQS